MKGSIVIDATQWPYHICVISEEGRTSYHNTENSNRSASYAGMIPKDWQKRMRSGCVIVLPERFFAWFFVRLPVTHKKKEETELVRSYLMYKENFDDQVLFTYQVFQGAETEDNQRLYHIGATAGARADELLFSLGLDGVKTAFVPESIARYLNQAKAFVPETVYRVACTTEDAWCILTLDYFVVLGSSDEKMLPEALYTAALAGMQEITGNYPDLIDVLEIATVPLNNSLLGAPWRDYAFYHKSQYRKWNVPSLRGVFFSKKRRVLLAGVLLVVIPLLLLSALKSYEKDLSQRIIQNPKLETEDLQMSTQMSLVRPDHHRLFSKVAEIQTDDLTIVYRKADQHAVVLQGEASQLQEVASFALALEQERLCKRLIIQNISKRIEDDRVLFEIVCQYEVGGQPV